MDFRDFIEQGIMQILHEMSDDCKCPKCQGEYHNVVVTKLKEEDMKAFQDLFDEREDLIKRKELLDAEVKTLESRREILWRKLAIAYDIDLDQEGYTIDMENGGFLYRKEKVRKEEE
jgi:hypothetical protein